MAPTTMMMVEVVVVMVEVVLLANLDTNDICKRSTMATPTTRHETMTFDNDSTIAGRLCRMQSHLNVIAFASVEPFEMEFFFSSVYDESDKYKFVFLAI